MSKLTTILAACILTPLTGCVQAPALSPLSSASPALADVRTRLSNAAGQSQLSGLKLTSTSDHGLLVGGKLSGRDFALRFPANWNRQTVLFAHGYGPPDGKPDTIPADPIAKDPSLGMLSKAYSEGFAVGYSAFDKHGLAVTSGITNTVALKRLADELGSIRAYMTGGSMGGSIAVLTAQRHPDDFAGALAICGVVSDWTYEAAYVTHMRALYNYFTRGTRYALPGTQDVTRTVAGTNLLAFYAPVIRLAADADKNPTGEAALIMRRITSAVPGTEVKPELSTFFMSFFAQAFGIDDFKNEVGGLMVGNRNIVYHSRMLSEGENDALNRGIQRYDADPDAEANMVRLFSTTGRQDVKLLTVHNAYDPLVSYEHEARLRARVKQDGNLANLAQQTVPTLNAPLPFPIIKLFGAKAGASHCGFTPQQTAAAWSDLRTWVERGIKPAESFRQNLDH